MGNGPAKDTQQCDMSEEEMRERKVRPRSLQRVMDAPAGSLLGSRCVPVVDTAHGRLDEQEVRPGRRGP